MKFGPGDVINGILLYTARVPVHVHGNGVLQFTVAACQTLPPVKFVKLEVAIGVGICMH